jgi:TonB family protein
MENFLIYLLKASTGIVLFYFFYYLVLRKETFYVSNRLYLIAGLVLAVILPAFPVSYTTPVALINNSDFFAVNENPIGDFTISNSGESESFSFYNNPALILSFIYLLGAGFFLFRLIFQTAFVAIQLHKGEKMLLDGVTVININKRKIMPFSFFNNVIINIQEYSKEELSNIIAHEKVHIQERHWVDLLIIELLTVVFWINPIVWLYEKSIKQNHEYLADQGVLLAGYNPGQYQALLINQLMGAKILGFVNNLNFSLNKKRMEMMKKEKSSGIKKVKLLIVLPVIAGLMLAFAKPEYVIKKAQENQKSDIKSQDKTQEEFVSSINNETYQDNFVSQTPDELIKVKGKIFTSDKKPLAGANVILKGTNTGAVTDVNGEFVLETSKKFTLVVSYVGYKTAKGTFSSGDKESFEVMMSLKKGVFNIKLPEITEEEIEDALPPPPPTKNEKESDVWTIVEDMPYYKKGGMNRLSWDILQETEAIMKKTKDRGEALVGFTVTVEGKLTNAHIVRSADSKMLDVSAVKIVQKLDNWKPGIQRGKAVEVDLTVPVGFN